MIESHVDLLKISKPVSKYWITFGHMLEIIFKTNYDDHDLDVFWQDCHDEMQIFHSTVDFCRSELEVIIAAWSGSCD